LRAELSPHYARGREIAISGPDLVLDARAYSVLALVLHELATNAAKYGALSAAAGRVSATWAVNARGDCELHWREAGGPPVSAPTRTGFGASLIRRSVPFDLGGESEIDYAPEGLVARISVPERFLENRSASNDGERVEIGGEAAATSPLAGLRILLVEDQFVIALDAEQLLKEAGATDIDIAATPAEAERIIASVLPDVALLDVNLGRMTSLPVAEKLTTLGVPFIFATGYGDSQMIGEAFRDVPVVRKPYTKQSLVAGLEDARRRALKP
jgi:CheY-like chemotaxis protein